VSDHSCYLPKLVVKTETKGTGKCVFLGKKARETHNAFRTFIVADTFYPRKVTTHNEQRPTTNLQYDSIAPMPPCTPPLPHCTAQGRGVCPPTGCFPQGPSRGMPRWRRPPWTPQAPAWGPAGGSEFWFPFYSIVLTEHCPTRQLAHTF